MKTFDLIPGSAVSPANVADIAVCVSANPDWPILRGIHVNTQHVVASDNHNMRVLTMPHGNEGLSFIFEPNEEIIDKLRSAKDDVVRVSVLSDVAVFNFPLTTVEVNLIKAEYPRYTPVLQISEGRYGRVISVSSEEITKLPEGNTKDAGNNAIRPNRLPDAAVMPEKDNPDSIILPVVALEKVTKGFEGNVVLGIRYNLSPVHVWLEENVFDENDELW
jgi:hypothetical protein